MARRESCTNPESLLVILTLSARPFLCVQVWSRRISVESETIYIFTC